MERENPVFLAVDSLDLRVGTALASAAGPHVGGLKLGLTFFLRHGMSGYRRFQQLGHDIFLDLKLHDIPNTVRGAVQAIAPLQPRFLTVHALGGADMIAAARDAAPDGTEVIAVSVLTSLDEAALAATGQGDDVMAQVVRLGELAVSAGAHGMVCSPLEVAALRAALGPMVTLIVPGIRPAGVASGDQRRVMTPRDALSAGASHLVIGRPISEAPDPAAAAAAIVEDIQDLPLPSEAYDRDVFAQ